MQHFFSARRLLPLATERLYAKKVHLVKFFLFVWSGPAIKMAAKQGRRFIFFFFLFSSLCSTSGMEYVNKATREMEREKVPRLKYKDDVPRMLSFSLFLFHFQREKKERDGTESRAMCIHCQIYTVVCIHTIYNTRKSCREKATLLSAGRPRRGFLDRKMGATPLKETFRGKRKGEKICSRSRSVCFDANAFKC